MAYVKYIGSKNPAISRACGTKIYYNPNFTLKEYSLKDENLKYVINPDAGLELIDIQSSFYFHKTEQIYQYF